MKSVPDMPDCRSLLLSLATLALIGGCDVRGGRDHASPLARTAPEPECADATPLRQPLFGDLHVHTSYSLDAAQLGNTVDPFGAYRYARGEPIEYRGNTLRIDRPLDFAGITDHSEFLAETQLCYDPQYAAYEDPYCLLVRGDSSLFGLGPIFAELPIMSQLYSGFQSAMYGLSAVVALNPVTLPGQAPVTNCQWWREDCATARRGVWEATQAAVRQNHSPCEFTALHAFEWTGSQNINGKHRNVVFGTDTPIDLPISYFDANDEIELWNALDAQCREADGCQALAIPHNANMGGGFMFRPSTPAWSPVGLPYSAELAAQRARLEPLTELTQEKGQSECIFGPGLPFGSADELCQFELLAKVCTGSPDDPQNCQPRCSDSYQAIGGYSNSCVEPADFVRSALRRGLLEQDRSGVNPFKLGFIGSTDSHISAPGGVMERSRAGIEEVFAQDSGELARRHTPPVYSGTPAEIPAIINFATYGRYNAGGLAVVWAEQNTRASVFAALQRRETYATSGPRIVARAFGGWDFPADLCDSATLVETGYAQGVPMGGDLPPAPAAGQAPVFAVSASMDPGVPTAPGMPLQRIQIVKGWTRDGESFEKVFEVAGDAHNGARVDIDTCETHGAGFSQLCTVWQDAEFDPQAAAFYYARVVENPQCRWSQYECTQVFQAESLSCADIDAASPLARCCDGSMPATVQERAWTSPIWYRPDNP